MATFSRRSAPRTSNTAEPYRRLARAEVKPDRRGWPLAQTPNWPDRSCRSRRVWIWTETRDDRGAAAGSDLQQAPVVDEIWRLPVRSSDLRMGLDEDPDPMQRVGDVSQ